MRRRLYFLLPDIESTRKTVDELLLAHIEFGHMHVMARESISLKGLPEANLLQKSDVVHGFESGMIINIERSNRVDEWSISPLILCNKK